MKSERRWGLMCCCLLASACAADSPVDGEISLRRLAATSVAGEQRVWHPLTLTFDGPSTDEGATPNPFRDYRLIVSFSKGAQSYAIPGYFAADGDAANSHATAGDKWRVHFTPPAAGTWTYSVSFRAGTDVALSSSASAGTATAFDGDSGTLAIAASNKSAPDLRAKGMLQYVGKRYLRFAGSGDYFIKGGADSPENFLGYFEFDQTTAGGSNSLTSSGLHECAAHAGLWLASDGSWDNGKGKGILGALNYLAAKKMNSVYFLTMNIAGGDGKDVWPWTSQSERFRFDVSKLAQWEHVFSHMDKKGLMLHVVTQEQENDQELDGGSLGNERKLYYRELIARFGHHLAVVWNLGEENTNTDAQRKAYASYIKALDPYEHPIVVHTFPGQYSSVYSPLVGFADFEGPSLQMGSVAQTHAETLKWIDNTKGTSRPWFVSLDEIGPANTGVATDANDPDHDTVRSNGLWGNLMAGGAGVEWYFGYAQPHDDLDCEDWGTRANMWDQTRHALQFFHDHLPFWEMVSSDGLTAATDDYVLAKAGQVYAVYLPGGATTTLTLPAGSYTVDWYNPRSGGSLIAASDIAGPGSPSLGAPPSTPAKDWVALVRRVGPAADAGVGADSGATSDAGGAVDSGPAPDTGAAPDSGPGADSGLTFAVESLTLIDADSDQPIASFDPLSDGAFVVLDLLASSNLNIRANVSGAIGSVVFDVDGAGSTESQSPYAAFGDNGGDFNPWTPTLGAHTVSATPYSGSGGAGQAGAPVTVSFTVLASTPDGGLPDVGLVDGGVPDGGARVDAAGDGSSVADGGSASDGGSSAADADAGEPSPSRAVGGCGCTVDQSAEGPWWLLLLVLFRRRKR